MMFLLQKAYLFYCINTEKRLFLQTELNIFLFFGCRKTIMIDGFYFKVSC